MVFFWSNEEGEPIHVHIAIRKISPNATKVWLTRGGGCILADNRSRIPSVELNKIMDVIGDSHSIICDEWKEFFEVDTIAFYC